MKKVIVDTNIFLRYLLQDVPSQTKKAEEFLKKVKSGRISGYVPQIIIFEIAYALEKFYRFPKAKVIGGLESILAFENLEVQDNKLLKSTIKLYQEKNVDITDCFLIVLMAQTEGDIFTFDKKIEKLKR